MIIEKNINSQFSLIFRGGVIGFRAGASRTEEVESLDQIRKLLSQMEMETRSLEEDLRAEIKDTEHLRKNIKMLQDLVLFIESIYAKMEKIDF